MTEPKRSWVSKVAASPVAISLVALVVLLCVVATLTAVRGLYRDRGFWDNVMVEAHGVVLEFLIIGILVFWVTRRADDRIRRDREAQKEIQSCHDKIDRFRGWEHAEAGVHIAWNIKRLNALGVTVIDLKHCHLKRVQLAYANLAGSDLTDADMTGTHLQSVILEKAHLVRANLGGAFLCGAVLKDADLRAAILKEAVLGTSSSTDASGTKTYLYPAANLQDADLRGADLSGANLCGVRLQGAFFNEETTFPATLTPELRENAGMKRLPIGTYTDRVWGAR